MEQSSIAKKVLLWRHLQAAERTAQLPLKTNLGQTGKWDASKFQFSPNFTLENNSDWKKWCELWSQASFFHGDKIMENFIDNIQNFQNSNHKNRNINTINRDFFKKQAGIQYRADI